MSIQYDIVYNMIPNDDNYHDSNGQSPISMSIYVGKYITRWNKRASNQIIRGRFLHL